MYLTIPLSRVAPFHPVIILFIKYSIILSAAGSHDGFAQPGLANQFHQIHHEFFECNYGDTLVPFDKWMGTFVDDQEVRRREAATK